MTLITITPKNKKELLELKHFIKEHNLTYTEKTSKDIEIKEKTENLSKNEFEKRLENSYTIEEFSQKTTDFLKNLSWKK